LELPVAFVGLFLPASFLRSISWVLLLTGLLFMATLQQRLSYWLVHGSWCVSLHGTRSI
jgi:hypothetical protein